VSGLHGRPSKADTRPYRRGNMNIIKTRKTRVVVSGGKDYTSYLLVDDGPLPTERKCPT